MPGKSGSAARPATLGYARETVIEKLVQPEFRCGIESALDARKKNFHRAVFQRLHRTTQEEVLLAADVSCRHTRLD